MKFKVIELNDINWTKYINNAYEFDFYHTSCYHQLEGQGYSYLFVAEHNNAFIALPLVFRDIKDTPYKDCTSVYGYSGPVFNSTITDISHELIDFFSAELLKYFKQNLVISAFSRLHPLIPGDVVFKGLGKIRNVNQTVSIDLKLSVEKQRQQFRKSVKSEINQLRGKKGYKVIEASSNAHINEFVSLYQNNMARVGASSSYFFDKSYFDNFLNNSCFTSKLLLAIKDEKIAAGAVFSLTNTIMQYHLSGTKESFLHDTPMKLLIDEARLIGTDMGLHHLHLGGGVGGKDDDSLFRFKAGFSKVRQMYRVWQLIVDPVKYNEVCHINGVTINQENSNFFPLYRASK